MHAMFKKDQFVCIAYLYPEWNSYTQRFEVCTKYRYILLDIIHLVIKYSLDQFVHLSDALQLVYLKLTTCFPRFWLVINWS